MKLLRSILGLFVGLIIMLHAFVPHEHYTSSAETRLQSNQACSMNLFMNLQLSLGLNHGAGHFEQYVEFDNSLDSFILPSLPLFAQPYFHQEVILLTSKATSIDGFFKLNRLRGPPSC